MTCSFATSGAHSGLAKCWQTHRAVSLPFHLVSISFLQMTCMLNNVKCLLSFLRLNMKWLQGQIEDNNEDGWEILRGRQRFLSCYPSLWLTGPFGWLRRPARKPIISVLTEYVCQQPELYKLLGAYWNVWLGRRVLMPECIGHSTKWGPIVLCYACLAWLVSVCYALAGFTLWRLEASAHNVSLCRVRQHEDVHRASDREGVTEEG